MITIKHFSKDYLTGIRSKKVHHAVIDMSFTAYPGEIFGLLGPNGAGKTTTLRSIATLLKPTHGAITVNGFDTVKASRSVRTSLSFLTNDLQLDDHFTPESTLKLFADLHQVDANHYSHKRDELVALFGLEEYMNTRIRKLSTGTRQKLAIAVSLIHNPSIVVFDEPTNALDLPTTRLIIQYLQRLRDEGKTLLISTHQIEVAEKLCDRIGIILDGRLQVVGTPAEILSLSASDSLEDAFFKFYDGKVAPV